MTAIFTCSFICLPLRCNTFCEFDIMLYIAGLGLQILKSEQTFNTSVTYERKHFFQIKLNLRKEGKPACWLQLCSPKDY